MSDNNFLKKLNTNYGIMMYLSVGTFVPTFVPF